MGKITQSGAIYILAQFDCRCMAFTVSQPKIYAAFHYDIQHDSLWYRRRNRHCTDEME